MIRPRPIEALATVVAVGYTLAVVVFVARHCYFFGDDYSGFLLAQRKPLSAGLLASIGGQVVPLARVVNWAFFRLFGLNYGAAVALLTLCHLVGVGYLYTTLELSKKTPVNAVLVALYASYVFTWIVLGWWIAGLERVPFVALATAAVYHYLRYVDTRSRRHLVAVIVSSSAALGFYTKGILVPFYMVAVDLARLPKGALGARFERNALGPRVLAGGLFVGGCACVLVEYRAAAELRGALGHPGLRDFSLYVVLSLNVFFHSLLGLVLGFRPYEPKLAVGVVLVLLVGYTLWRVPRAWLGWSLWFALVFANVGLIGSLNRVGSWGALLAFENRYYWELAFITVLITGMLVHRLPGTTPEALWATRMPRRTALAALGAALLVGYAGVSYRNAARTAFALSQDRPQSKAFVENLRSALADLEAAHKGPVKLVDGDLPVSLTGLDLLFRRQSDLLTLFRDPRLVFRPRNRAEFKIESDGTIARLRPRRGRKAR